MIDRRNFVKLLLAAPAVKCIDTMIPEKKEEPSMPKALVVDPYLVNMKDLGEVYPGKVIRLRRQAWGSDYTAPIKKLF